MEHKVLLVLLTLVEGLGLCVSSYIGAKRRHKQFGVVEQSRYDKVLPKVVQKYFKIGRRRLPMALWYRYIGAFAFLPRFLVLFLLSLVLPPHWYWRCYLAGIMLLVLFTVPLLILEGITEWREYREKKKRRKEKKKFTRKDFEHEMRVGKEMFRIFILGDPESKAYEKYEKLVCQKLSHCVRRQSGKEYFPESSIKYAEEKIISPYKKYVFCEITADEKGKTIFSVYAKKDKRCIFQKPIKKG